MAASNKYIPVLVYKIKQKMRQTPLSFLLSAMNKQTIPVYKSVLSSEHNTFTHYLYGFYLESAKRWEILSTESSCQQYLQAYDVGHKISEQFKKCHYNVVSIPVCYTSIYKYFISHKFMSNIQFHSKASTVPQNNLERSSNYYYKTKYTNTDTQIVHNTICLLKYLPDSLVWATQ